MMRPSIPLFSQSSTQRGKVWEREREDREGERERERRDRGERERHVYAFYTATLNVVCTCTSVCRCIDAWMSEHIINGVAPCPVRDVRVHTHTRTHAHAARGVRECTKTCRLTQP